MTRHLLYLSLFVLVLSALLMLDNPAAANESQDEDNMIVDYQTISSAGPFTELFIGADLSSQMKHAEDTTYQVYPQFVRPGDYGTFLVVDDTLYAPDLGNHGGTASWNLGTYTVFTEVSQSTVTGSGTSSDPFQVVTVVDAGSTGLRITQTDSYIVGQESYRTDIQVANSGDVSQDVILYRAMDCYLGGSDFGYGVANSATGGIACTKTSNNTPAGRIQQIVPLTGGNQYYQAHYSQVWSWIATKQPFPNTCRCEEFIDNGAGISW